MQANDLIADLRAEVSAWWEGKMADHRSSVIAAAAAALVKNPEFFFCVYTGVSVSVQVPLLRPPGSPSFVIHLALNFRMYKILTFSQLPS